jgi:hypothetical protein
MFGKDKSIDEVNIFMYVYRKLEFRHFGLLHTKNCSTDNKYALSTFKITSFLKLLTFVAVEYIAAQNYGHMARTYGQYLSGQLTLLYYRHVYARLARSGLLFLRTEVGCIFCYTIIDPLLEAKCDFKCLLWRTK